MGYEDNKVKEKTATNKLLYWVIFKISYYVGYAYYFIKGLILRK